MKGYFLHLSPSSLELAYKRPYTCCVLLRLVIILFSRWAYTKAFYWLGLAILLFIPVTTLAQGSYQLTDNFERSELVGGDAFWTRSVILENASAYICSSVQYGGSTCLGIELNNSLGASLDYQFISDQPDDLTVSFRFRTDSSIISAAAPVYFMRLFDENENVCARFYYHPDDEWFQFDYLDDQGGWHYGVGTTNWSMSADTWYSITIRFKAGPAALIEWSLNGRTIHSLDCSTQATGISWLNLGQTGTNVSATGTLYYDDVSISDTPGSIDELTRGLVSFTFDDGHDSNWDPLKGILDEYGIKASFYAVTDYQENGSSFSLTEEQLILLDQQNHDIQSHTASHADLTTLNPSQLSYELEHSKAYLEGLGFDVDILTLPYGRYNDDVIQAARDAGYSAVFNTEFGFNARPNLDAPWRIMRLDAAMFTVEEIKNWMDLAAQEKLWVIFYYHAVGEDPAPGGDYPYYVSEADLRELIEYALTNEYDVVTANKILDYPAINSAPQADEAAAAEIDEQLYRFNLNYSDAEGHSDLKTLYFLLNDSPETDGGIYLKYEIDEDKLYLWDGGDWGSGATINSGQTLYEVVDNCFWSFLVLPIDDTVSGTAFAVRDSAEGSSFELNIPITFFHHSFEQDFSIFTRAVDRHGGDSGMLETGSASIDLPPAQVRVAISPQQAADDGAGWTCNDDTTVRGSGDSASIESNMDYITVKGTTIDGWTTPGNRSIPNLAGVSVSLDLEYQAWPALTVDAAQGSPETAVWSIDNGLNWYSPGDTLSLAPGEYTVIWSGVEGYQLNSWSGDISSTQDPLEISLSEDTSITASFEKKTWQLVVTSGAGGSTDRDGISTWTHGDTVSITPSAAAGYSFQSWAGDASGSQSPLEITVTGDTAIRAQFTRDTGLLTINCDLLAGSNAQYCIAGPADFNNGQPLDGITSTFSQNVPTGAYIITRSQNCGFKIGFRGQAGFSTGIDQCAGMVGKNSSCTITADLVYFIESSLGVSSSAGGHTSMDGLNGVADGETVSVLAIPDDGFYFEGWSGDASGQQNPLEIAVDGDLSITAIFKPCGSLRVHLTPDEARNSGGWKLKGQTDWRPSHSTAHGIPAGEWEIVFRKIEGFKRPSPCLVTVQSGGAIEITQQYSKHTDDSGTLRVSGSAPPGFKSFRWRVSGEDRWYAAETKVDLAAGQHSIEFEPLPGWLAPLRECTVEAAETIIIKPEYSPVLLRGDSGRLRADHQQLLLWDPQNHKWVGSRNNVVPVVDDRPWPVPGDYDGDGSLDQAFWYTGSARYQVNNQFSISSFGKPGDIPVPSDYDGDGKTDPALYRPSEMLWLYAPSTFNNHAFESIILAVKARQTGLPLPGPYISAGRSSMSVYSCDNSSWTTGGLSSIIIGGKDCIPVPGDYDGDGLMEAAVLNPDNGELIFQNGDTKKTAYEKGCLPVVLERDGQSVFGWFDQEKGVLFIADGTKMRLGGKRHIPLSH